MWGVTRDILLETFSLEEICQTVLLGKTSLRDSLGEYARCDCLSGQVNSKRFQKSVNTKTNITVNAREVNMHRFYNEQRVDLQRV